jgi:hypothetical protein
VSASCAIIPLDLNRRSIFLHEILYLFLFFSFFFGNKNLTLCDVGRENEEVGPCTVVFPYSGERGRKERGEAGEELYAAHETNIDNSFVTF